MMIPSRWARVMLPKALFLYIYTYYYSCNLYSKWIERECAARHTQWHENQPESIRYILEC